MIGMMLFYLVSGDHPPEGGARLVDWDIHVSKAVRRRFPNTTMANRVARMIVMMTDLDMNKRMDVEAALAESESLLAFLAGDYMSVDHDVIVENILKLTGRGYIWDPDKIEGRLLTNAVQANFIVRYQQRGMKCEIDFSRSRSDADARASFGTKINQKIQDSLKTLKDAGWDCATGGGVIRSLNASIKIVDLIKKKDLGEAEIKVVADRLLASFE